LPEAASPQTTQNVATASSARPLRADDLPKTIAPLRSPSHLGPVISLPSRLVPAAKNESVYQNESKFIPLSARNGAGIQDLIYRLQTHVESYFGLESELITRERHRSHLQAAHAALARALAEDVGREEIIAEELRLASRALGRLTGKVDVEDILDVIFRDFCIGK
jgi:tRNA U34 5-carboxymethylaminomethyl modifying GTPase MnmE/TrmE